MLACLGDPALLLLDEPSSGCDSYTRELVRKDIMSKKELCAILVSTHHMDDIEIMSSGSNDRIWFLNEHLLVFDGPLALLNKVRPLSHALLLTHSLTHALLLTHLLTHSLTHLLNHSLTLSYSLTHSLTHSPTHSRTHSGVP
jgi:ABC-type multidrug transport system ATPase subunit